MLADVHFVEWLFSEESIATALEAAALGAFQGSIPEIANHTKVPLLHGSIASFSFFGWLGLAKSDPIPGGGVEFLASLPGLAGPRAAGAGNFSS